MDYQEKLRLAKEALDSDSYDKETIEYIFPELKESEDERIRKEIIKFIKVSKPEWKNYSDYSFWIAWLEKQGEQKEIELFGNIYEEVEDNSSELACSSCALFKICEVTKPNLPCVRVDGSLNRHFVLVSTKLNAEEKTDGKSYEYYPKEFSSYEEYVKYLKEKGFALEAPEGMHN